MLGVYPVLQSFYRKVTGLQVNVPPFDAGQFANPEPVVESRKNHQFVPVREAGMLADSLADGCHFLWRYMPSSPLLIVGTPRLVLVDCQRSAQ